MKKAYAKFFPIENSLGFLMYRTALEMKATLQRKFTHRGYDITTEQWSILLTLWEREGRSQQEIADKTSKDKASITRFVSSLERTGFLVRRADPRDRRQYFVHLTNKGRSLRDALMRIVLETLQSATRGIPERRISLTKQTLIDIYQNLRGASAAGGTTGSLRPGRRARTARPVQPERS